MPEAGRHHANNSVQVAIDPDLLSKGLRIAAERSPPETVAEHDSFNKSRLLVVRGVGSAQLWPRRQHGEIIGARREQFDALRFLASREIPIRGIYSGDVVKNIRSVAQVP